MTTYIVLKFTVNRFHIMLCFYYAFWTGKFQIELIVKKSLSKSLVQISGMNLFKVNRDRKQDVFIVDNKDIRTTLDRFHTMPLCFW